MNEIVEGQASTGVARMVRRRFLFWLLGFSVVSTLSGVLFPIASYLWPPARASSTPKHYQGFGPLRKLAFLKSAKPTGLTADS